jgi:hypothetical protein
VVFFLPVRRGAADFRRLDVPLLIFSPPGAIPDCPGHLFEPGSILPHGGWMAKSTSRGLLGQRSRKPKSYYLGPKGEILDKWVGGGQAVARVKKFLAHGR